VQARLVGGTTVINSAICVRTPGDIFAQWQREHGVGGDAMATAVWQAQEGMEGELHASIASPAVTGRNNTLAMAGAQALGIDSHYMTRYVRDCEGRGQCLQGCRAGRKQSTNLNLIPEVIRRGGHVLSCAPVKRVVFEGTRATGVDGHFVHPTTRRRGAAFSVHARRGVVLAASVTRTPNLLATSGFKHAALGEQFRAHPGAPVFGSYEQPVHMADGVTQGWASMAFRDEPGLKLETLALSLDMVAGRLPGAGAQLMERLQEYPHLAMFVQATRAQSAGSVRPGPFGRASVRYTLDRQDMLRFRAGMHQVAKIHVAAGAKSVLPCIVGMPYRLAADEVDKLLQAPLDPRAYVAILSHLFGGCVMGSDPSRAVCDGRGRVHGTRGLYVVDASVIPTNLGVNPQATIMGLAVLFARQMLEDRVTAATPAVPSTPAQIASR
jgi:choline dehydrogenase-like flavoprotein